MKCAPQTGKAQLRAGWVAQGQAAGMCWVNYFLHLSWQLCIIGVQHSPLLRSLALKKRGGISLSLAPSVTRPSSPRDSTSSPCTPCHCPAPLPLALSAFLSSECLPFLGAWFLYQCCCSPTLPTSWPFLELPAALPRIVTLSALTVHPLLSPHQMYLLRERCRRPHTRWSTQLSKGIWKQLLGPELPLCTCSVPLRIGT